MTCQAHGPLPFCGCWPPALHSHHVPSSQNPSSKNSRLVFSAKCPAGLQFMLAGELGGLRIDPALTLSSWMILYPH